MTDHETARMAFRISLFRMRGLSQVVAERLAASLAARDRDRDDRRYCLECAHLHPQWGCERGGAVLPRTIQRCPSFAWTTPAAARLA